MRTSPVTVFVMAALATVAVVAHCAPADIADYRVFAGSSVVFGGNAFVQGTVASNGPVILASPYTITGGWVENAGELLPAPGVFSAAASDPEISTGHDADLSLDPGSYSSLLLGNKNTLSLTAGTYTFGWISAGSGTSLNLDLSAGDITLYADSFAIWGDDLHVTVTGYQPGRRVYAETHGDWAVGDRGFWFGDIHATSGLGYDGSIYIGRDYCHVGSIRAAGGIYLGENAVVVPLPAAVSLGLLGLGTVALRRRRMAFHRAAPAPEPGQP